MLLATSAVPGRRLKARWGATLFLACLLPGRALAQDATQEPLLTTASRYAQTTYEAPASVTVISREEIQQFGFRTLGEALSMGAGMFTSYDRDYTYLTVRGMARLGDFNTRVLVLLDGRRLNGPTDDSTGMGTETYVDLETLERIEIIRGPGSTMYGTNALYAVINLVTRTGATLAGAEVIGSGGSFHTAYGSVIAGGRSASGFDVFAQASGYDTRGPDLYYPEFDAPDTNHGGAIGLDKDRFGRGFVRVMKGDFSAEAFYGERRKQVPTASYQTIFGDPRERTRDAGDMVSAAYEHAFADLSRVWVTASYNENAYSGDYPYPDSMVSDYIHSRWLTTETQYQRLIGNHRLSVGAEARWNALLGQGAYGTFADERKSWVLAGFAQGELHLGPRATLYAGARYDHYQSFGGTVSPRLALVTRAGENTYFKAIYGRAFRAPSDYELYYQDGSVTEKPALHLDPEKLETFEVAIEHRLRPNLKVSISGYHTTIRNLIGLTTDPADSLLVYANIDGARTTGVELALEGRLGRSLLGRAAYALQDAVAGSADARPANSPQHLASLGASLNGLGGRLVSAVELHFVGGRPTLNAQLSAHTLLNLALTLRPKPASPVELQAKISNAFDTAWADPGGEEHLQDTLPQDGRTAWAALRVRF
ncbi:MAG TPA: TonB-dependent receptor [Vicinamibacteria bacterium]|nr:TonB-dependent receptor [Vicinamibacteria bacterium]